jgi:hypothetical protein
MQFDSTQNCALWHSSVMPNSAPNSAPRQDAPDAVPDERSEKIASVIRTLIAELPAGEQQRLYDELRKKLQPINTPQAGDVLGAIVRLFPMRREWTVEELKNDVREQGVSADPKQIYNALGYLKRKGKIQRVGHGRYMVDGALLETVEDLGIGPPTRHEIDET